MFSMLANDLDDWPWSGALYSFPFELGSIESGFLAAGYILNLLLSPPKVLLGLNPLELSEE
jgi:hypothetical protein